MIDYDLQIGKQYGRLTVLEILRSGRVRALCRCECGATATPEARHVAQGKSKSCGCAPRKDAKDISAGARYGRLTVLEVFTDAKGKRRARCKCDCGERASPTTYCISIGETTSCGCLSAEMTGVRSTTHGETRGRRHTTEHARWAAMIQRCTNPKNPKFKDYGARGICVCKRWRVFENFLADMGRCPPGMSIDRRNNDGNYEPGNCRWATLIEQANNKRRPPRISP